MKGKILSLLMTYTYNNNCYYQCWAAIKLCPIKKEKKLEETLRFSVLKPDLYNLQSQPVARSLSSMAISDSSVIHLSPILTSKIICCKSSWYVDRSELTENVKAPIRPHI